LTVSAQAPGWGIGRPSAFKPFEIEGERPSEVVFHLFIAVKAADGKVKRQDQTPQ
jgi:hypothetical protein